ncbi:hypothetical protein [Noviherbaspirillum humi]|uniref:hypothetical protein n=1 Tax=Noviherbaspirillum humi TaxID=1688639 RepID=UPI001FEC2858|nr:hypothetical protein [Noviherbaspirillum humi]
MIALASDGVLVIDDTGDRKENCFTDHVAPRYLDLVGNIDDGFLAATTPRANEQPY